jgi:hypothetical protein
MPKYYVKMYAKVKPFTIKSPLEKEFTDIVDAADELEACVKTWLRMRIAIKGSTWKVSELGQDDHDDDIYFNENEVKKAIIKYQKKRGDGT